MAISYGVTGPNLRGSGVKFDVRKDEPYLGYEEFDFDVPVGKGEHGPVGSCWDRYMVRIREVKESCKIIRQAVAKMTPGDVHESIPKRIKPPAGEVYMRTECPRGELGYYIVSDGSTEALPGQGEVALLHGHERLPGNQPRSHDRRHRRHSGQR